MNREMAHDARSMLREMTVTDVHDDGAVQTVDLVADDGGFYAGVPVVQVWGLASSPPLKGLKALVLGVGGDPANLRALLFSTGRRMGGMETGTAGVYANNGSRVALLQGGTIQVQAGTVVDIIAPNVTINASGGITLNGSVTVNGPITLSGSATLDGTLSINGDLHVSGSYPH